MGNWYYVRILRRAWALYRTRLHVWSRDMIWFVLQTVALIAVLYTLPGLGNLTEQIGQIGVGATAAVISAALLFLWDFLRAPAHMDAEQRELIDAQRKALDQAGEAAKPRLVIDSIVTRPNDPTRFLLVRNPSPTMGLADCIVNIETMHNEDTGVEELSLEPLRTEKQEGDRPKGRFNLDPDSVKRVPLVGGGSGPNTFRIILAESTPKFQKGRYLLHIRASTNMGGSPDKVIVTIHGDHVIMSRPTAAQLA